MIDLTYAIFTLDGHTYWGSAWTDPSVGDISIGTANLPTYTAARKALDAKVSKDPRGLRLKYFDGEHGGCVGRWKLTYSHRHSSSQVKIYHVDRMAPYTDNYPGDNLPKSLWFAQKMKQAIGPQARVQKYFDSHIVIVDRDRSTGTYPA